MKQKILFLTGLLVLAFSVPASAHFQMVYTPESAVQKTASDLNLKLVFTHPFGAGHTMDMGAPQEFFVIAQKGEEGRKKRTDLTGYLKPVTWTSLTNSGQAYEAAVPKKVVRGMGDYVFCLVPEPYYEGEEDIYIQQVTKMVMNVSGLPGNWAEPVGLKAEILPLDKPYGLWTGNVFRGVVTSNGKAVPGADIEVEYMNHKPNMKKNKFAKKANVSEIPNDAFETMTIKADEHGMFTFGIPKAGWWGFCALGVGPDTQYKGKDLSQDAVIWVQAHDME